MSSERRVIDLADGWEFRADSEGAPSASKSWRPALPLPSTVHQDLIAAKVIPDPFLAKDEEKVQWVGEQTWTYRKTLTLPENVRRDSSLKKHLVFEGLDTYATVRLNGKVVLEAENMFLTHRVDIASAIGEESNTLEVTFENAEKKGDEEVAQHPGQ